MVKVTISTEDQLRGALISKLIISIGCIQVPKLNIRITPRQISGSYLLRAFNYTLKYKEYSIGLLTKYSECRRSPWRYGFNAEHQEEIKLLLKINGCCFVCFINGNDGVTCVNAYRLMELFGTSHENIKSVHISRKEGHAYRLSRKNGRIKQAVRKNSFPNIILDSLKENL